jgi:hypothetical protein
MKFLRGLHVLRCEKSEYTITRPVVKCLRVQSAQSELAGPVTLTVLYVSTPQGLTGPEDM